MVCRLVYLNNKIVGSLLGVKFLHKCQSVLAIDNKTLGGYRIAKAVNMLENHSDDTSIQGVSFGNRILEI